MGHPGAVPRQPPCWRRWPPRVGFAAVALVVVAAGGVWVLWPVTPSVADARQRVAATLDVHGAPQLTALPSPDRVGQAVVATENSRFSWDFGLDPISLVRTGAGTFTGSRDTGAATLEIQLAKNLYTPAGGGVGGKVEQVELAFKLDSSYTKDQILLMYLAAVYYGHGFYGLPAASSGYFGVAPGLLTWGQASMLAGLVQAPSAYDPYTHLELARQRQRHVLDRLVATGVLTAAQASAAFAEPVHLG